MTRTIDFPHLGIHLSSVGNHITVFGFDIAYYGMIIGAGILAGIFMAVYEAKRTGQKEEDYYDLSICAVIISIIGARAYYVIFSWDMYKDDLLSIFNLRQGIPQGVYVKEVDAGSPAMAAGIQSGDIITNIADTDIINLLGYHNTLMKQNVGDKILVRGKRQGTGGEYVDIDFGVTVGYKQ